MTHPEQNGVFLWSMAMQQEPIEDGGTDSIYVWPIFQAYVREYPHKIWPNIWYSTSILGS